MQVTADWRGGRELKPKTDKNLWERWEWLLLSV
jgi:hypothetical protein